MVKNIQALRGIAVMLVLLAHLTKIEEKYFSGARLLPEFLSIGISGVDLFFVISGFVMVFVTREVGRGGAVAREFLVHRVTRIYPLYWIYSLLVLAVFLLRPSWVNSSHGSPVDLWASFLLLPLPPGQFPLLGVGWSLIHEMYFYLVFSIVLLLPVRWLGASLLVWFFLVLVGLVLMPITANAFGQLVLHPLTLEFIVGCVIGRLYLAGRGRFSQVAIALALVSWFGFYMVYVQMVAYGMAPVEWRRPLVFGVPVALFCYGIVLLERDAQRIMPGWLIQTGDWSYSIYLSHLLVISALGRFWGSLGVTSSALNAFALLSIYAVAILMGGLSYRWIEKPLQRLVRQIVVRDQVRGKLDL